MFISLSQFLNIIWLYLSFFPLSLGKTLFIFFVSYFIIYLFQEKF